MKYETEQRLDRICRLIVVMGVIVEAGLSTYAANKYIPAGQNNPFCLFGIFMAGLIVFAFITFMVGATLHWIIDG